MENVQWIFSGIGTTVVSSLFSLIIGLLWGYKVGVNKNKQLQDGGKGVNQIQKNDCNYSFNYNNQSQTAGDNSVQYQENTIDGSK